MTKKHYIVAAKLVSNVSDPKVKEQVENILVQLFREDNPRFNTDRFKTACE